MKHIFTNLIFNFKQKTLPFKLVTLRNAIHDWLVVSSDYAVGGFYVNTL